MTIYEWLTILGVLVLQTAGAMRLIYTEFVPRKDLGKVEANIRDLAKKDIELAKKDVEILNVKIDNVAQQIKELKKFMEERVQWN